ncbi:hypothetical protein HHK36_001106 [Tetracentron sinense]|uniref:Uncharacterized protein n=1 Tax=Tetracentron sinense TaxID=13715 RepID=A0A834ZWP8_TETSI|nr:hypothetical protein HHK36_001106 [Tetracentron sinense]
MTSRTVTAPERSALSSTFQRGGRGGGRGSFRGRGTLFDGVHSEEKDKLKCDYCGRIRHTHDQCWQLHGRSTQRGGRLGGCGSDSRRPDGFGNPSAHTTTAATNSKFTTTPTSSQLVSRDDVESLHPQEEMSTPPGLVIAGIDLNHANLQGSLAKELSLLSDMSLLHLNRNIFTGTVPNTFGDLSSLSELDLNNNHFSGPFPPVTLLIPNLIYLNLRFNNCIPGRICRGLNQSVL